MITSEKVDQIIPALVTFQSTVEKIDKNGWNPFTSSNYATFDHIMDNIRPKLSENGLFIMQTPKGSSEELTVKTRLWHESGQWMESDGTTLRAQKTDPQGSGGAITYAKRYDLCAFLGLNTGDDDDGNTASGKQGNQQQGNQNNYNKSKQQGNKKQQSNTNKPPAAKKEDVKHFIGQVEQFAEMRGQSIENVLQLFQIKSKNDAFRLSEKAIKKYTENMDNFIQKAKNESA